MEKTIERSADNLYAEKPKLIDKEIKLLKKNLKIHRDRQKKDRRNWGLVGDINGTLENLKEINGFLNKQN